MKVKLNIQDRFVLISLLPEKGNFQTMSTIEGLQKLYPTQEEVKEFNIVQDQQRVSWNEKGAEPKEFEFTDNEVDVILEQFKERNDKDEITMTQYAVYKKFVNKE